jgi:hypothetical protein
MGGGDCRRTHAVSLRCSTRMIQTYCAFATEDIEADHTTLRARGVDVDAVIARKGKRRRGLVALDVTIKDPVPPQFFFRDIDGNRFLSVRLD